MIGKGDGDLRGQMQDDIGAADGRRQGGVVAHIALHNVQPPSSPCMERSQAMFGLAAGAGEIVEYRDRVPLFQEMMGAVRTNKSCATGYKKLHLFSGPFSGSIQVQQQA